MQNDKIGGNKEKTGYNNILINYFFQLNLCFFMIIIEMIIFLEERRSYLELKDDSILEAIFKKVLV